MPLDPQVRAYLEPLADEEVPYPQGYEAADARIKMRVEALWCSGLKSIDIPDPH